MKQPTIATIFDRKKKASTTKESPVEIRVSYDYKTTYFNAGVSVRSNEWKGGKVVKRLDADVLNEKIDTLYKNVYAKINELMQARCFSLANLRAAIESDYMPKVDMWQWIEQRIEERPITEATKRQHRSAMSVIQSLDIFHTWGDLTVANIKRLDERLRISGLSQVTIHSYHKRLKPYLRDATIYGIIAHSPYERFKTPRGTSKRIRYLTADECSMLESTPMPSAVLQVAKDLWLFQRYTGLAYADVSSLTEENFVEQDGSIYIMCNRVKNSSPVQVKLIGKAVDIYNRYNRTLPHINLEVYNRRLKLVGLMAGIKKPLTSHMARHTFATQALHAGLRIEVVSKMLAHSDIQTTQIYAKVLAEDIEAGFDALDEK